MTETTTPPVNAFATKAEARAVAETVERRATAARGERIRAGERASTVPVIFTEACEGHSLGPFVVIVAGGVHRRRECGSLEVALAEARLT